MSKYYSYLSIYTMKNIARYKDVVRFSDAVKSFKNNSRSGYNGFEIFYALSMHFLHYQADTVSSLTSNMLYVRIACSCTPMFL